MWSRLETELEVCFSGRKPAKRQTVTVEVSSVPIHLRTTEGRIHGYHPDDKTMVKPVWLVKIETAGSLNHSPGRQRCRWQRAAAE